MFTSGFALFAERTFAWKGRAFGPREIGTCSRTWGCSHHFAGRAHRRLVKRFGEPAPDPAASRRSWSDTYPRHDSTRSARLVVVATICSFGNGVIGPPDQPRLSECGPPRARDRARPHAVAQLVAQIVAPAIGGVLIGHHLLAACWRGSRPPSGSPGCSRLAGGRPRPPAEPITLTSYYQAPPPLTPPA